MSFWSSKKVSVVIFFVMVFNVCVIILSIDEDSVSVKGDTVAYKLSSDPNNSSNVTKLRFVPKWYKPGTYPGAIMGVVPGTQMCDIEGYPRDRKPDIGAYEYHPDTCNEDLQYRIFPYIGDTDPNTNFRGDLNWDGIVNEYDYWMLGSWWINEKGTDPNTITPYPLIIIENNTPPVIH